MVNDQTQPLADTTLLESSRVIEGQINMNLASATTPLMPTLADDKRPYYEQSPTAVPVYATTFPRRLYDLSRLMAAPYATIEVAKREPDFCLLKGFADSASQSEIKKLAEQRFDQRRSVDRFGVGVYLRRGETPLVAAIEQRIAELTATQVEQGEGFYVLRLLPGQGIGPHLDYFSVKQPTVGDFTRSVIGGQRIATLAIDLATVDVGGESEFPLLNALLPAVAGNAWYCAYAVCDGNYLALDRRSLNVLSPPKSTVRWLAIKFIRQAVIQMDSEIGYDGTALLVS